MFAHHEVRSGVGCAVTDRWGGRSAAPYAELNLADHVGDDPATVADNRQRVRDALGIDSLVFMHQVHGAEVAVVDASHAFAVIPGVDALVTRAQGIGLGVLVADCTPVLMWDRRARVVAVAHVGRRGLVAGVVPSTITTMASLGARADRIYAHVGPSICPEHYEVPAEMRDDVGAQVRDSAASTSDGHPAINIRHGIVGQLYDLQVRRMAVTTVCTWEQERYFSYRRDGVTGRFGGFVWRT